MKHLILIILFMLILPTVSIAEDGQLITRAEFCTELADREPADSPESITAGQQTVYFFTEVLNSKDKSISHRWYYNDIKIADVTLKIGADHWRTWSTKQVWHLTAGRLKVQVLDAAGELLTEKEIAIQ